MNNATHTSLLIITSLAAPSFFSLAALANPNESAQPMQAQAETPEKAVEVDVYQMHIDVFQMHINAKALVRDGDYPGATEAYQWLWKNATYKTPFYGIIRLSDIADEINKLISVYKEARPTFTQLRDNIEPNAGQAPSEPKLLRDWLVLNNRILNENDRVNSWILKMDSTLEGQKKLHNLPYVTKTLLVELGYAAALGRAMPSGEKTLNQLVKRNNDRLKEIDDYLQNQNPKKTNIGMLRNAMQFALNLDFGKRLGQAHLIYLAADRDAEAWLVLKGGLKIVNEKILHDTVLDLLYQNNATQSEHIKLLHLGDADLLKKCDSQATNQDD